jgi:outer membrane protein assembly factor BamB
LIERIVLKKSLVILCISSFLIPPAIGIAGKSTNSLFIETAFIKTSQIESKSGIQNSPWPMFLHDAHHTGRSSYGPSGNWPTVKWKYKMNGMTISSPSIDENGVIYIGANNFQKSFYAINNNGTEKWHIGVDEFIFSSPAISSDNIIYVGANDGCLYAIYKNGTIKWNIPIGDGWVSSSPVIGNDGTIYIASVNSNRLCAVNPNGTIKWYFITTFYIYSSPAIDNEGIIYFGSHDTYIYALYPNGTLKWRYKTNDAIKGSPSVGDDGTIYICSWDNYLYAIASNGTLKWKFSTGDATETSPSIASDGTIYIGSYNGKIFSINPIGLENWHFQTGNVILSSPAIDIYGTIYCGSYDGNLYALNPDGTLRWKFDAGDSIESSVAIGADGTIYIAGQFEPSEGNSSYTYLYALGSIDNQPPYTPTINGPLIGKTGQKHEFNIEATDPEGNDLSYYVDWGDGTNTGWMGPYPSGQEQTINHTWDKKGTYIILVKAKDNYSQESEWGTLSVRMPYEPPHFQFFEWLLERFPNAFPILRYLLGCYDWG